jgi:hypothetical protein
MSAPAAGGGGLERNDRATLLLVATLITTLLYQVGSNVPGGYWQDNDEPAHRHRAGDPILRDEHYGLYMLFRWSSWIGFGSSMVLTMGLLTGVATGSRFVRWLFVVAYSTLVLTFVTSQTHSTVWSDVLVWAAVMAALAFAVTYRRLSEWLCGDKNITHDSDLAHRRRLLDLLVLPVAAGHVAAHLLRQRRRDERRRQQPTAGA